LIDKELENNIILGEICLKGMAFACFLVILENILKLYL